MLHQGATGATFFSDQRLHLSTRRHINTLLFNIPNELGKILSHLDHNHLQKLQEKMSQIITVSDHRAPQRISL